MVLLSRRFSLLTNRNIMPRVNKMFGSTKSPHLMPRRRRRRRPASFACSHNYVFIQAASALAAVEPLPPSGWKSVAVYVGGHRDVAPPPAMDETVIIVAVQWLNDSREQETSSNENFCMDRSRCRNVSIYYYFYFYPPTCPLFRLSCTSHDRPTNGSSSHGLSLLHVKGFIHDSLVGR